MIGTQRENAVVSWFQGFEFSDHEFQFGGIVVMRDNILKKFTALSMILFLATGCAGQESMGKSEDSVSAFEDRTAVSYMTNPLHTREGLVGRKQLTGWERL